MAKLWIPIDHQCVEVIANGSTAVQYLGYSFIRYTNNTCTASTKLEISSGTIIRIGSSRMHGRELTLVIHRRPDEDSGECAILSFHHKITIDTNVFPIFIACLTHRTTGWTASLLAVNGTLIE